MIRPAEALPRRPTFIRMWAWSFAIWTAVSALFSLQNYVWYQSRGEVVPASKVISTFTDWQLWAIFTPFLLCFVWRHPVTRATWRTGLPWQILGGLALPALFLLPFQGSRYLLGQALAIPDLFIPFTPGRFFGMFVNATLTYLDIVLVGHAIHYARASRQEGLHRAQLEARLAEAQLQVLRLQLHPHFLFNTLHTVSALMHKDLRAADRMLALLGDLLRDSFEKVGAQEVSLKQELGFLDRYLEIERTRFRDRLTVDLQIDPEALDAWVPNLILQPLLENAIRHGIARRQEAGRIELVARRALRPVGHPGPGRWTGLARGPRRRSEAGSVSPTRRPASQQLYRAAHRFELRNRPEGGLEVGSRSLSARRHPPPPLARSSLIAPGPAPSHGPS